MFVDDSHEKKTLLFPAMIVIYNTNNVNTYF